LTGLAYAARLGLWRDAFAGARVEVAVCHPAQLTGGQTVTDFLSRIGVGDLDPVPKTLNPRIGQAGCDLLRQINRAYAAVGRPVPTAYRRAVEADFAGDPPQIAAGLWHRIRPALAADLERVRGICGMEDAAARLMLPPDPA
jgi:hypothetical protein